MGRRTEPAPVKFTGCLSGKTFSQGGIAPFWRTDRLPESQLGSLKNRRIPFSGDTAVFLRPNSYSWKGAAQ